MLPSAGHHILQRAQLHAMPVSHRPGLPFLSICFWHRVIWSLTHTQQLTGMERNKTTAAAGTAQPAGVGWLWPEELASPPRHARRSCCNYHIDLHFSKHFNLNSPAVNYRILKQKPNHSREPEGKEMNHQALLCKAPWALGVYSSLRFEE